MKLFGFQETRRFTKRLDDLLSDDEYAKLQEDLCNEPEIGAIIKGSGKRGGARVIYYWAISREKILMLDIYAKNEKEDLTETELKQLRHYVEEFDQ